MNPPLENQNPRRIGLQTAEKHGKRKTARASDGHAVFRCRPDEKGSEDVCAASSYPECSTGNKRTLYRSQIRKLNRTGEHFASGTGHPDAL